ncbi:hypothetical protein [Chryseobacterium flavum]|uniref:hypothetical protein n=1 Tax=Chryseobacterium flavum TaxID=415851 RepID=UPI0028AF7890|nr:hypothetical protein [Chryseobacterium flavum]
MKTIYFIVLLFLSVIVFAQDRLSFIKNDEIKEEVQKSVEYLNKTNAISAEIKSRVIFITFDFDDIFDESQKEYLGINYSTYLPTEYSVLNSKGEFMTDSQNNILYYNYSQNIVFVFFKASRYLDLEQMKSLSHQISINKKNLMKTEFFKYEKGNEVTLNTVENFISLEKQDGKFIPVRVNTFDLKTFVEVWYGVDVDEIPVSQESIKSQIKKDL